MVKGIKELLGYNYMPPMFGGWDKYAFDDEVVNRNIQRLHQATDYLDYSMSSSAKIDISAAISKLQKSYQNKDKVKDIVVDKRTAKALSYHLQCGWELKFINYYLEVLNANWSNTMLRGLQHSVMSQWLEWEPDAKESILSSLFSHIESDHSRCASQLKPLMDYFNDPYKIGNKLYRESKEIEDCCPMFGLPKNRFNYSFFTPAVISYYEMKKNASLDELRPVLKHHNSVRAYKTVLPRLIIERSSQRSGISGLPREWVDYAIERIGDPSISSNWAAFPLASREVQNNLETARGIVLRVLSAQFINTFFSVLCHDADRLKFWLKYTKLITDFRVYGTQLNQAKMSEFINNNILISHFSRISSNTLNSALVMSIDAYVIIEFTETGALYVYRQNSNEYDRVFKNTIISKLDDLKLPYLGNLIEIDGDYLHFQQYGRMVHTGHWQSRLERWISRMV